ncbi:tyrosine-sulfated glycopeptide receptor 1-like [Pyrus ussuriensis x Pyrus communis]|uniref:Tyrosine-sulfated glycopeptide receptor 1-like n=1 Tax=Pyrus ussuriensis x Pyrus communis TaxID=2448454 RepID=A0A5N5I1R2_9ROSA|nr:tyrosine-sulfated glycopeptide receptor 1-like [Pyrus ussuriensis x Pyrus communis]
MMPNLNELLLDENYLNDTIPPSICNILELQIFVEGKMAFLDVGQNNLFGRIPIALGVLRGSKVSMLLMLRLRSNYLNGCISHQLCNLHGLHILDLSHNSLSGTIPIIPSENQLQTLNVPSIYTSNPWLCGLSLSTKCPGDDTFTSKAAKDKNEEGNDKLWFYISMVLCFIVGFWGVCGTLILKTSWRYAYFQLLDDIKDKGDKEEEEGEEVGPLNWEKD